MVVACLDEKFDGVHDLSPHLGGGGQEDDGVDRELCVDDHITNEDGDGVQEPAVEPDHQHRRNVHLKARAWLKTNTKLSKLESLFGASCKGHGLSLGAGKPFRTPQGS